jgi:glucose/arabinose dehydrogenase
MRLALAAFAFLALFSCTAQARIDLSRLKLPPGFEVSVFAEDVDGARSMALGDKGTLFVGTMREGKVYAIANDGKKATKVETIATGLDMPNGVAVKDGALYVAEVDKIWRYDAIESHLGNPPKPALVYGKYPSDRHHGWKFIRFGPDGWLYVPVGAPCNICEPPAPYASITRLKPDGSAMEIYARGIRNSVGFDWDPRTQELWFTDNGRDMMGDDMPSDELNHAPKPGMNFGYPYCHQGDAPDPEFGKKHACGEFTPPAAKLGPPVASLGKRF